MDTNQILVNLIDLLTGSDTLLMAAGVAGLVAYIITSALLGRVFKKASQPVFAAFVPIWNIAVFYRLGGYSALWVVFGLLSLAYVAGSSVVSAYALSGAEWTTSGAAAFAVDTMPFLFPLIGILLMSTSIIGLLAAYNIGRAFEKDAGYLLLFVFLLPVWLIALAFTSYDWDEDSANPNSIGEMDRSRLRSARAREVAVNREKSSRFLEPVAPQRVQRDEFESDYDRALREQEAKGGVPAIKERGRKRKKDEGDAKIVDAGSTGVDTKSDWF